MVRARNLAIACSTFSVFGRLTARHLDRLFVPNCQLRVFLDRDIIAHGRRRASTRCSLAYGSYFHPAWLELGEQLFSKEEAVQISWYNFDWSAEPVLQMALGTL